MWSYTDEENDWLSNPAAKPVSQHIREAERLRAAALAEMAGMIGHAIAGVFRRPADARKLPHGPLLTS